MTKFDEWWGIYRLNNPELFIDPGYEVVAMEAWIASIDAIRDEWQTTFKKLVGENSLINEGN